MGGFQWRLIVDKGIGERAELALADFKNWLESECPENEYIYSDCLGIQVIKPEQSDEVYLYQVENDDLNKKIPGTETTFKQFFGESFPGPGQILLDSMQIAWLWKWPKECLTKAAECFEKYGALEVWWTILGDGVRVNDITTDVITKAFQQKGFNLIKIRD